MSGSDPSITLRTSLRHATRRAREVLLRELCDRAGNGSGQTDAFRQAALAHVVNGVVRRMCAARGVDGERFGWNGDDGSRQVPSLGREVLGEVDRLLGHPELAPAWEPGCEETLGWVFQYFNAPDLDVFRSARAPKVPARLVASKTQLFTPRWIVTFLVQNTLGRLWGQMHPDSGLAARLDYLVPAAGALPEVTPGRGSQNRDITPARRRCHKGLGMGGKRAREIRVLDPACGAMHFGLVAFDLLAEMYREERARAGQPGWPDEPSVQCEAEIPAAILANNLFGIDIDPTAVRLSAMTLCLRAGIVDAEALAQTRHLVCADVLRHGRGFAEEARASGEVAAVVDRTYDVVVTNPPYMDSREYNDDLKTFLNAAYPRTRRNLYTVFLERCLAFLEPRGRLGMITPQTFMFISSFADARGLLRESAAIETLVQAGLNTFPDAVVDAAFYVLRREDEGARREASVGTYFRELAGRTPEGKRLGVEESLRCLRSGEPAPRVYRHRQGDFDALPGRPWVYWVTPGVRRLFEALPPFSEVARPVVGLQTSDNFRFLRYWWEVADGPSEGTPAGESVCGKIAFACKSREAARASGAKWFPHMKGGCYRRWYGNQAYVVNWASDGAEIRSLGLEAGRIASRPQNMDDYFRSGVTWTHTSSRGLSVRILPAGFICNVEGMAAFQKSPAGSALETLAILNSSLARYVIDLLNPTVHFGGREVGGLPYPIAAIGALEPLIQRVEQAIALVRQDAQEDEATWDFVAPPDWSRGIEEVRDRQARLTAIEREIDHEVFRLYGIGGADRAAIERDASRRTRPGGDDGPRCDADFPRAELARRWVSYAVGVVLGRFRLSEPDRSGSGRLPSMVRASLEGLVCTDGVAPLTTGAEGLAPRVQAVLGALLGGDSSTRAVRALLGEDDRPEDLLQRYFERRFFAEHVRQYRKRPVYWLLQSPGRQYGVYVYHGSMTGRTLSMIRERYVAAELAHTRREIEHAAHEVRAVGRARAAARRLRGLRAREADLAAFDEAIRRVMDARNERGEVVGWKREIDDGVILNLAPLHELIPSWRAEPRNAWVRLQAGECDWSFTARRYWPDRVLAACRTNKSIALGHGQMEVYEGSA